MKKIIKTLIIIIISVIVILVIWLMLLLNNENSVENNNTQINDIIQDKVNNTIILNNKSKKADFKLLKERDQYLLVENEILKIIEEINTYNSPEIIKFEYKLEDADSIENERELVKTSIQNKLATQFKNEFNIDLILNKDIWKNFYDIEKIYVAKYNEYTNVYLIFGKFSTQDYSLMFVYNTSTNAYNIYLNEYLEKYNYTKENINNIVLKDVTIEKNIDNVVYTSYSKTADINIAKRYFISTREIIEKKPEELYYKLDHEYREKKFPTLDSFIKFAKKIKISTLDKYKIIKKEDYDEIICVDKNGNIFVFNEYNVNNYTIILDTYTIDMDTFVNEYNNSDDEEKININIMKINQMINQKDYLTLYEMLNTKFRENKFSTVEILEKYIKENFYEETKLEVARLEKIDNYYLVVVRVIDAKDIMERKLMNFAIKLNNIKSVEISFSIDEEM